MSGTVAVRERPLFMSGPMVRAILDDRKTKTRRVVKPSPESVTEWIEWNAVIEGFRQWRRGFGSESSGRRCGPDILCPYGQPGDRLWVRENWNARMEWPESLGVFSERWWQDMPAAFRGLDALSYIAYAADRSTHYRVGVDGEYGIMASATVEALPETWRPSIYMPRWASRLTLEITEVRVERLQEITEADAIAEGVEAYADAHMAKGNLRELTPVEQYEYLWNSLNESRGYGWDVNPWVWMIAFRGVDP